MKKSLKKTIAVILVAVMFSSCGLTMLASAQATTSIPTIYVHGQGDTLFADKNNTSSEKIWSEMIPDGAFDGLMSVATAPLVKGVLSGDYTEYANVLCNYFEPIYAKSAFGPTGDVTDDSGRNYYISNSDLNRTPEQGYYIKSFNFSYDWRRDPVLIAADLDEFIGKVMAGTKATKVNIVGRCLGANVILAYLSEYCKNDLSKINKVAFYSAGFDGFDICNALFSGEITVKADALERYLYSNVEDDGGLLEFFKATTSILNSVNGLQLSVDEIMDVYEKIAPIVVPRMLNASFGSFPSYWSMVGDKYYEKAKALYLSDKNADEYAGFTALIDYYHYNIGVNAKETINRLVNNGVNVGIFSKYDTQMLPISETANTQSDDYVSVSSSSFGSTCADVTKTFSADYLAKAEANSTAKYINPEKNIDASTALLPDHTWYIKGVSHMDMPACIDEVILHFLGYNGYLSVFDEEDFSQYLLYNPVTDNDGTLSPVTDENSSSHDEWNPSIFDSLIKFFRYIFDSIIKILDTIKNSILSNQAAMQ